MKSLTANGQSSKLLGEYALRSDIRPDPNQPRTEFPPAAMAELRESIAADGIQDALVVRKDPEGKTKWMIIEGERRWRVAGELKIERLPITVREMSEEEVRKYQRIVGTQRLNLSALEAAEAFHKELQERRKKDPKFSVADLGKSWGRERSAAYELYRLNFLSEVVRKALTEGKLDLTKAQLFGQVPPDQHAALLKHATQTDWQGRAMTVKQLRELIDREYSRQLSAAPFKWDAVLTSPKAGDKMGTKVNHPICTTCPKRTGNIEGASGNQNVCTDVKCFEAKTHAHAQQVVETAEKEGKRIIDPKLYERTRHQFENPKDRCWGDSKNRTWGQLAKAANVTPAVTVNEEGAAIEVFTLADKEKIFKECKIRKPSSNGGGDDYSRKRAKAKKENAPIVHAATGLMLKKFVTDKGIEEKLWRLLADAVAGLISINEETEICRRRGLAEKMTEVRDALEGFLTQKLTTQQLQEFVVEALLCANWSDYDGKIEKDFEKLCELGGVKLDKIAKEVKEWNDMGHSGHGNTIAAATSLTPAVQKIIEGIDKEHAWILQEAMKKPGGIAPEVYAAVVARMKKLKK